MQRRVPSAPTLITLLAGLSALTAGCNDLGTCDDPARGRRTVKTGSGPDQVMYAGQAIMQRSCATGCHSSKTSGGGRQGAPAGLNFDLAPIESGDPIIGA